MFVGGFSGALVVIVTTKAAPEIGVALMTVAIVCGQSGGSLLVDRVGLSPAGHQPVSAPRLVGVALAIAAVVVGGLSARTEPKPVLLGLLVFAGFCFAGQQAVNARLGRTTGEPLVAATVNFAVGGAVLTAVTLIVVGGGPPNGWGAPPLDWIGGLLGAAFVIVSALVVPVIGVLRLTLAAVAGQSAGALVLDVVSPAPGEAVTVGTVVGVGLALAAVAVSGRSSVLPRWLRRRQRRLGKEGVPERGVTPPRYARGPIWTPIDRSAAKAVGWSVPTGFEPSRGDRRLDGCRNLLYLRTRWPTAPTSGVPSSPPSLRVSRRT